MKKRSLHAFIAGLVSIPFATYSYQIKPSNFYTTRPKTLRRIAKNVSLALAIDKIYKHQLFSEEDADLLKQIPVFRCNFFNKQSTIETKKGISYSLLELIAGLKKIDFLLAQIQDDPECQDKMACSKVAQAVAELIEKLEKIAL
jgi:hypothetical protein